MYKSVRIILVSFADGLFSSRKTRFIQEAKAMEIFDDIRVFDADTLPDDFKTKHLPYMKSTAKGFGYWIWKPLIIRSMLEDYPQSTLIVYLDVGYTLNPGGRTRMLEYIDISLDSPYLMLSFQNVYTEYQWTKSDLAWKLGVNENNQIMKTSQLSSGFLILGRTDSNFELVRQWQEIATDDGYRFSDDSPSVYPNHPRFREHRHDQSISSLLRKIRGTTITHYEVQKYDNHFDSEKPFLPAWATRLHS